MVKVSSPDAAQNISKVMVHFEATTKTQKIADRGDLFYRTVWEMFDKWSVRHAFRPQLIRHSDIGWLRVAVTNHTASSVGMLFVPAIRIGLWLWRA